MSNVRLTLLRFTFLIGLSESKFLMDDFELRKPDKSLLKFRVVMAYVTSERRKVDVLNELAQKDLFRSVANCLPKDTVIEKARNAYLLKQKSRYFCQACDYGLDLLRTIESFSDEKLLNFIPPSYSGLLSLKYVINIRQLTEFFRRFNIICESNIQFATYSTPDDGQVGDFIRSFSADYDLSDKAKKYLERNFPITEKQMPAEKSIQIPSKFQAASTTSVNPYQFVLNSSVPIQFPPPGPGFQVPIEQKNPYQSIEPDKFNPYSLPIGAIESKR